MHGGKISGNTATGSSSSGGVSIWRGTFRIINGVIYGNEADHGDRRNTAYGFAAFASYFGSGTAQHGTFYDGNWQSKGDLFSRNLTIHVIDGVLVNIPIIAITTQPSAMTNVFAGNISGNLTVAANVTQGASLSYQWFGNTTNSNVGGTAISGATGASFAIPTGLAMGRHYFFVEVRATEGAMPVRSSVAVVYVSLAPIPVITITSQPTAITNETVGSISGNLTVAANVTLGASLGFQWFSNTTNSNIGGTVISGATGANFAIPTGLAAGTHYFFVEVSATEGAMPVRSNVAVVHVSLAPVPVITITTQPTEMTNETVGSISGSLTVAANVTLGASLGFQWFSNTTNSNIGGTAISGATGANFAIPSGLAARTHYFFVEVRATGGAMSVRSSVAVVNVSLPVFTVSFNMQGGTPQIPPQAVNQNGLATRPPTDPTRAGHTFRGWFTSATGSIQFNFNAPTTYDRTAYAQWGAIRWIAIPEGTGVGGSTFSNTCNIRGIAYGNGKFIVVHHSRVSGARGGMARSIDGGMNWTAFDVMYPPSLAASFFSRAITYGNGTFIAPSHGAVEWESFHLRVMYSHGGANWSFTSGHMPMATEDIAYGSGTFIAVGLSMDLVEGQWGQVGRMARSIDNGQTWTAIHTSTFPVEINTSISGVTYGNGTFIAVGSNGRMTRSINNGQTWTAIPAGTGVGGSTFTRACSHYEKLTKDAKIEAWK